MHSLRVACDVLLVGLHASDVQLAGNAALALRELLDEKSASSRICAHLHDEAHVVPLLSAAGAGQAHSCNVGSLLAGCAKRDQRVTLLLHKLRALGALRDAGKSAVSSSN